MTKKKILIDCRFIGSGSALGRYAEQLTLNLLDLKSQFLIRPILRNSLKEKIPRKLFKADPMWTDIVHYSFAEQFDLWKIIKKEKPALVHFTHFNAPIFSPKPFLVTIHDLTISQFRDKNHSFLERAAYNFLLKNLAKRATHIIAPSERTKKDIEKILHVPEGKISKIYEGVEEKFKPQKEDKIKTMRKNFDLNAPFIMYAGQWRPHKNLLKLFEAFAILKNEYKIEEKLLLVGTPDPRYPEIPAKVKELGLENKVRFLGFVEEEWLSTLYSAASICVVPSLAEGFGFPPLEAMACGTVVASSQISCLPEILDQAAIFFDPYDEKDMAVKIYTALTNDRLREVLIERGLHWVKRYNWHKVAEQTLRVYENLID